MILYKPPALLLFHQSVVPHLSTTKNIVLLALSLGSVFDLHGHYMLM